MSVIVDVDHEAGDLSEYSSTVTDSGDLSVTAGSALASTSYGLSCVIDDTNVIYGQVSSLANSSGTMRVRFYFKRNTLTIPTGNNFYLFGAYNNSSQVFASVHIQYFNPNYQVFLQLFKDDSSISTTTAFTLTDAEHYIEFKCVRATGESTNDGSGEIWVDGTSRGTISGIDNYTRFAILNFIRFGAVLAIDASTSGEFYLDQLVINDDGGEIGPLSPTAVDVNKSESAITVGESYSGDVLIGVHPQARIGDVIIV